jgi:hypothetical protein
MMALRQNKAANKTCAVRIGTKTPEKAESVSEDPNPSSPDVSTKAPKRRSSSFRNVTIPINVRPANNRANHQILTLPSPQKLCSKPTA